MPKSTAMELALRLREPNGVAAARGVFRLEKQDPKSRGCKQRAIFVGARLAWNRSSPYIVPKCASSLGPEVNSNASHRDMALEDRKHGTLFVLLQMEKAVPGDDGLEAALDLERAHVGFDPCGVRKAGPAVGDHGGGGIDAGDVVSALDEVPGDGLAGAATEIEDASARRKV